MSLCLVHSLDNNSRDLRAASPFQTWTPHPQASRAEGGDPRTGNNRGWVWGGGEVQCGGNTTNKHLKPRGARKFLNKKVALSQGVALLYSKTLNLPFFPLSFSEHILCKVKNCNAKPCSRVGDFRLNLRIGAGVKTPVSHLGKARGH